jgi:plastocyanin
MRLHLLSLALATAVLSACSSDRSSARTDTAAIAATPASMRTPSIATAADSAATSPAATTPKPAPAPATGATYDIHMLGDAQGYRFDPANITIHEGDAVRFIMISGGPHDVAFDSVAATAHDQLAANMGPNQTGDLSSPFQLTTDQTYTISFARIPPGTYTFHCTPHQALGMKGSITVQ